MRVVIHKEGPAIEAFSKFSFSSLKMVKSLLCFLERKEKKAMLICEGGRKKEMVILEI